MSENENQPTQESPASDTSSDEVFRVPAGIFNMLLVAVLALVAGVAIGAVAFGEPELDEATLRQVLREQLADVGTVSGDSGGSTPVNYLADDDAFLGPEDAPVVIVEFSDFLCSFCGRHFTQTLEPLLERYDGYVKYVYRDNPGVGGQAAVLSAMAAECVADQGMDQFWEYHALLYENQSQLSSSDIRGVLIGFAGNLDLNVSEFTACYDDQRHLDEIRLDALDAQSIGAQGTPAFYINGFFLSGARDFQTFQDVINRALRAEGINPEDI